MEPTAKHRSGIQSGSRQTDNFGFQCNPTITTKNKRKLSFELWRVGGPLTLNVARGRGGEGRGGGDPCLITLLLHHQQLMSSKATNGENRSSTLKMFSLYFYLNMRLALLSLHLQCLSPLSPTHTRTPVRGAFVLM